MAGARLQGDAGRDFRSGQRLTSQKQRRPVQNAVETLLPEPPIHLQSWHTTNRTTQPRTCSRRAISSSDSAVCSGGSGAEPLAGAVA